MNKEIALGVLILSLGWGARAAEPEYRSLEGSYKIGSRSVIDPAPNEKKDRVYLSLSGEGAKAIYEAMPGKAVKDACEGTELVRSAGGLSCSKSHKGNVLCSVAITLDRGQTAMASVC
jgi:hypothetical protein